MSLRVTQQYVDVIGENTGGKLRATQLYVDVIGTPTIEHLADATSTLSLTSTAENQGTVLGDATSTLSLTQEAVSNIKSVSATNTLTLTQSAEGMAANLNAAAVSTLTLTQSANNSSLTVQAASSAITFTQFATSGHLVAAAGSVIELDHLAYSANEYPVAGSHLASLTHSAVCMNLHVYAESELELVSLGDHSVKARSATSELSLTQSAFAERVFVVTSVLNLTQSATQGILTAAAEDQLELSQEARVTNINVVASSTDLTLTQEATSNIKMLSVTSTLVLEQSVTVLRPFYVSAISELQTVESVFDLDTFTFVDVITGLTDAASAQLDGPRSLSHIISFSQTATASLVSVDAIAADAESVLSLTQEARISIQEAAISAIVFTQVATAVVSEVATSTLSLSQSASFNIVRGAIAAASTLDIKQAVAFVLDRTDTLCSYSPFVGSSSDPDAPTPPPSTYPAAGGTPGFRLQYPETGSVTDELILRAPNLGNIDRLSMVRINRETRGGTLIIYADPIWPKVETLLLTFSGLSEDEAQDLLDWMETYLGQEIRLIDWEDRVWKGVIVNPQDPVVQDGKGCQFTASFEFEGSKV